MSASSITEGCRAAVDDTGPILDAEALEQGFELRIRNGISVDGSAGIHVAAEIRVAQPPGPGHTAVTILCDGGTRCRSRLFSPAFLHARTLPVPPSTA